MAIRVYCMAKRADVYVEAIDHLVDFLLTDFSNVVVLSPVSIPTGFVGQKRSNALEVRDDMFYELSDGRI